MTKQMRNLIQATVAKDIVKSAFGRGGPSASVEGHALLATMYLNATVTFIMH